MDKKNGLIGAILLVAAFGLMFWQSKVTNQRMEEAKELATQERAVEQYTETRKEPKLTADGKTLAKSSQQAGMEDGLFRVVSEEKELAKEFVEAPEKLYTLENDYISVRFTTRGGGIKDIALKKYPEAQGEPQPYVFNQNSKKPALSLAYLGGDGSLKDYAPQFEIISQGAEKILFGAKTPEGVEIYRGYSITNNPDERDPYILLHETRFVNKSSDDIDLKSLFVAVGTYPPTEGDTFGEYLNFGYYDGNDAEFVKIGTFHDSKGFFGIGKKSAVSEVYKSVRPVIWGSIKNQFFTSVLTPEKPASGIYVSTTDLGKDSYEEGLMGSLEFSIGQIESGKDSLIGMQYYVGPKEYTRLASMGQKQDLIMQFGFFRYISQILLVMMKWVHTIVPNWGLTIIVVTIIIKLILWPLTAIQVRSASRMAKIQKPLQEIKEKFKDNPQKVQTETMRLFKENKVNPAAGCLPLLVQLPIFLGLYFMLRTSSELRFANFLWIHDLSVPDTVGFIAGFPINILPFIMALSMFWQMRSTPTPTTDNMQKKIFQLMPFIFLIFCYSFPSGLVLYWTVQNLLTILQQSLMKKMKDPVVDAPVVDTKPLKKSSKTKGLTQKKKK